MDFMKTKLTLYILPHRRRNCLIIYLILLILFVTLVVHKIYLTTRTWTEDDWFKLRPTGGIINYQHDYLIQSEPACDDSTQLVVFIFSRPEAFSVRSVLRKTWLSMGPEDHSVVYRFILGSVKDEKTSAQVKKESQQFGDIILDQTFSDSYQLLVLKTISMVNWVTNYCPNVDAMLKTDDDSWINVPKLLEIIPTLKSGIHGHVYRFSGSSTDPNDPWYMPPETYPFGHYPDFTSGSGYLLVNHGTRLFNKLLKTLSTIRTIWTEDIFLTGLVAEKAGIHRYHHEGFNPTKVPTDQICHYKHLISSHKLNEYELSQIYTSLTDPNLNC